MASCFSMFAPRYRTFVTVQRCLNNSIRNTQKHLCCREFGTYSVPSCSVLPVIRNDPFESTRYSVLSDMRRDGIFYSSLCRFSSGTNKSDDKDDILGEVNMTRMQKLKFLLKNYWHVALPVHIITSCIWGASFYYLSLSGIDIANLLESMGAPEKWIEATKSSKAAHLVTMYTLYKIATPVRYAVTIAATTLSINVFRRKGWIKPLPNKDQLKKMYEEKKGAFKDFTASYQDKIQSKKGDFIKTKEEIKQHYVEARDELQKSVIDTKKELNKGAKEVSSELKHVGGLLYKRMKEQLQDKPKADYVAKPIKEKIKK